MRPEQGTPLLCETEGKAGYNRRVLYFPVSGLSLVDPASRSLIVPLPIKPKRATQLPLIGTEGEGLTTVSF